MEVTLIMLFASASISFNLPPGLLSALCFYESSHVVNTYVKRDGGSPSIGVCQVKLDTARVLGFKGTEKELMNPATNIYYSAAYLRHQLDRYKQDTKKAVAAYNAGRCNIAPTGYIRNNKYVTKVFKAWKENR